MKPTMEAKEHIPFEATHPGSLIHDELKYRGISQKEFARDIGMQPTMLNEIIKEKRAITADIALLLEKGLNIPADYWMRHQAGYELDCARIQKRNIQKTKQIEIWGLIKQYVPVSIFTKLGILSNSLTENIERIWDIYEIRSIDLLVERVSVNKNSEYYKKSDKLKTDQVNILGWSQLSRWQTKAQKVCSFNPDHKDAIVAELNELFRTNKDVVEGTGKILNKFGIKFLVLEPFKQSPIDGYSFWSGENPAMVVTIRKKNLDNFAFTIMHELGHIFLHLLTAPKEDFLDLEYQGQSLSEKKKEAHRFASECFLNERVWQDFFNRNKKFIYSSTETEIIQLATKEKIHPSIIFGRYCFETGNYAIRTSIDRTIR